MSANNGTKPDSPPINWLKPEPIERVEVLAPAITVNMLPKGFRAWLVDIAQLMCAPLDYAVAIALIVAGFLLAGQVAVRPKRVDFTWLIITNIWGFIVGPPSMLKSPMIAAVQAPLEKIEKELKAAYTNDLPKDLLKAQIRQLVREITRERMMRRRMNLLGST